MFDDVQGHLPKPPQEPLPPGQYGGFWLVFGGTLLILYATGALSGPAELAALLVFIALGVAWISVGWIARMIQQNRALPNDVQRARAALRFYEDIISRVSYRRWILRHCGYQHLLESEWQWAQRARALRADLGLYSRGLLKSEALGHHADRLDDEIRTLAHDADLQYLEHVTLIPRRREPKSLVRLEFDEEAD